MRLLITWLTAAFYVVFAGLLVALDPHAIVITEARKAARLIEERGDEVSYDLLVSEVLRTGETQAWVFGEHLADASPAVEEGDQ